MSTQQSANAPKHFGPHNAQEVMDGLISLSAACGEAVQGIMRHSHHSRVASGAGIIEARGNPELAAKQAELLRAQHAAEAQRALRQVQAGMQSVQDGWNLLNAALAMAPGTPKQNTAASELAENAGTSRPAPDLALAGAGGAP